MHADHNDDHDTHSSCLFLVTQCHAAWLKDEILIKCTCNCHFPPPPFCRSFIMPSCKRSILVQNTWQRPMQVPVESKHHTHTHTHTCSHTKRRSDNMDHMHSFSFSLSHSHTHTPCCLVLDQQLPQYRALDDMKCRANGSMDLYLSHTMRKPSRRKLVNTRPTSLTGCSVKVKVGEDSLRPLQQPVNDCRIPKNSNTVQNFLPTYKSETIRCR